MNQVLKEIRGDECLVFELSRKIEDQEIKNKYYFLLVGIWRNIFKKKNIN